jgi:hypothetical protein
MRAPTVFSNEWKCGDKLKATTRSGRVVDDVQACKVDKVKRTLSRSVQRNHDFVYFEKRGNLTCDHMLKLRKRQEPHGPDAGHAPVPEVPAFNTIKPIPGKQAYARITAGMYNELFYTQADASGLMTVGAQHGVRNWTWTMLT